MYDALKLRYTIKSYIGLKCICFVTVILLKIKYDFTVYTENFFKYFVVFN